MGNGTCSIEGCAGTSVARGWCDKHYRRWQHTGDAETIRQVSRYPDDAVCMAEGCAERPFSSGYCGPHYRRWKRHGDPLASKQRAPYRADEICAVEDCGKPPRRRGYCERHGSNLVEYGNPVPQKERPLEVRLREVGWTVTESGCWEWNGKRNDNGYGIFNARLLGYEGARAHRVMYEHFVEPIPEGMEARHRCDNPPCVNPDHIDPGTHAQNMADIFERGRHPSQNRTECSNGHDLTLPGATRIIERKRGPETVCVECTRTRGREYMRRKRAA